MTPFEGRINWIYKCLDYWASSQLEQPNGKCAHLEKRKLVNLPLTLISYSPTGLYEYANSDNLYFSEGVPFLLRFSIVINYQLEACFSI